MSGGTDKSAAVIAVIAAGAGDETTARARRFAARHGLTMIDAAGAGEADLLLAFTDDRLELREGSNGRSRPFAIEFSAIDLRTGSGNLSRKQPLARAIGPDTRTVVDATAGLGHDAVLLACMGFEVTAIERSPVVAALLEDGLRRAMANPALALAIGDRLHVVVGEAKDVLPAIDPPPDAVYVDPMYPPKRRKSALARKHIRLVRAIVGDDPDAAELVRVARAIALRRVVVKRPHHAPPLAGPPDLEFGGKLARYDVYLSKASP